MPGMFAWIGFDRPRAESQEILQRAGAPLAPGSPQGITFSGGAAAAAGHQTLIHAADDSVLVLCGTATLSGDPVTGAHGDTIIAAYRAHGAGILKDLHGPFSLAVIDAPRRRVLLAVDRMGIQPLCYCVQGNTMVFSSRADCIVRHPDCPVALDPQAIYDYLYFHCVPSPRTIYRGVEKLLPGQYIDFSAGSIDKGFYWSMRYEEAPAKDIDALATEFRSRIRESVRSCTTGGPVGTFLSGGTDSSTISGYASRILEASIDSFSIGFSAEGYDEMEYARIASRHFGTRPHEYYVTPQDVVEAIPMIASAYDEPFGNASAVPTYYCARHAADRGIGTLLAGDGGDELFAGNARYAKQLLLEHYQRLPRAMREHVLEAVFLNSVCEHLPVVKKVSSYISQARTPLPDRLESYNFLHRTSLDSVFSPDFLATVDPDAQIAGLREVYFRADSHSALNRMLHLDLKLTLADNDLRKVNRMCELAGVAVRYPMLSEDLVAFSGRVPPELKLRGNQLRYFFKYALRDLLPAEILTKRKQGFGLPFGLWLRDNDQLRALAADSLQAFGGRGILRPAYLDELLRLHREEHAAYYGVMIWVVMMLEQWFQAHEL